MSIFDVAGSEAGYIIALWWIFFGIGAFVFIAITGVLLIGLWRHRSEGKTPISEKNLYRSVVGAVVVTVLLLFAVLIATFRSSQVLPHDEDALTIDVLGKQWWWAVTYLDKEENSVFETANEIHIPTGELVRFRLRSGDVIHSFWVPNLGGKMDMVPGMTNTLWMKAEKSGTYRGQCAEFCGVQHANMAFYIIAQPREEFDIWMAAQQKPANKPVDELAWRGQELFLKKRCIECHAIRGLSEMKVVPDSIPGPDLTHLASRETLASGIIPNREGYLGGWIADPHGIKPGNRMPAVPMSSEDFLALLHFLKTLK